MKNEVEKRIVDVVDQSRERIAETLQQLIRFESIVMADPTKAGPGERECQEYLEDRLRGNRMPTRFWKSTGVNLAPNKAVILKAGPIWPVSCLGPARVDRCF